MSLLPLKTYVKPLDENKRELYATYHIRASTQDPNDHVTLNIRHVDCGNGAEWVVRCGQLPSIQNKP
ncbi:hypothetical protein PF006_g2449 [Phytophthora fragariae]|uniref:Uncharacterized protein n=1 Tax=Phytophthora fragariae TaxID=53985 RepID=A0A6A3FKW9_9STRA|nr:hypothetical protein PF009_g3655 [Phytophthora fragariae]KAE9153420.1 hypothetical protein PF006_g2449 [Phytophthora fragariae]